MGFRVQPLLEVHDVWKIYPNGVVANRGVSLVVKEGEVLALLGENGAGKTTLVSIIAGYTRPTRGRMLLEGRPYQPRSPRDAMRHGVVMVPQHPRLVENMRVYENVGIALASIGKRLPRGRVAELVKDIGLSYGLRIDPYAPVHSLSMGERQRVELVKAIALNPKLLLLDEPTTHLTPEESGKLVKLCGKLASEGTSVVYITHRLREALEVADRIAVMRDGRVVAVLAREEADEETLLVHMFGERLGELKTRPRPVVVGGVLLRVENLWVKGVHGEWAVRDVSFEARGGEIVGIAGIAGNGQLELFEALAGLRKPVKGRILVEGFDVTRLDSRARLERGMAFIPEERVGWGLVPGWRIAENAVLGLWHSGYRELVTRLGFIRWGLAYKLAERITGYMGVEAPSVKARVESLSGGNMQRLMVGREIFRRPRIMVAYNPTAGLDYVAAERVRSELVEIAAKGSTVIIFSEDVEELVDMASRILVMSKGTIVAEFTQPVEVHEVAKAMVA